MSEETKTAYWYVSQTGGMIEKGLRPTLFDPDNQDDSIRASSPEEIEQEFQENVAATGMYLHAFSAKRLALHETLVSISLNFRIDNEDELQAAFNHIYNQHVLPGIDNHRETLEQEKDDAQNQTRQAINEFYDGVHATTATEMAHKTLQDIHNQFSAKLDGYNGEVQSLRDKRDQDRQYFSRSDRQRLYELEKIIDFMHQNERPIVQDLLSKSMLNEVKTAFTRQLISGDGQNPALAHIPSIIQSDDVKGQYATLPHKTAQERKAALIAAGPASGKSKVVDKVKQADNNDHTFMPMNPDYFKNFLLSHDELSEEDQILHGSLTHPESSKIFDDLAERWQEMAGKGKAPDLLMDIARAGGWMRSVAGAGGTPIEIHTPVVPMEEALERAYHRGEQTGRYIDTSFTIDAHRGQIAINIEAMRAGNDMYFYDQNVPIDTDPADLPVIAHYRAQGNKLVINDLEGMTAYMDKAGLNVDTVNADTLWEQTQMSAVARGLHEHAAAMDVEIRDENHNVIALMGRYADITPYFEVKDTHALETQLGGKDNAHELLKAMAWQGVALTGEAELHGEAIMMEIHGEEMHSAFTPLGNNNTNIDVDSYARLLEKLVEQGQRVAKTQPLAVYDIRSNEGAFQNGAPHVITRNLDDNTIADDRAYDPEAEDRKALQICVDPKVHATEQTRAEIIDQIIRTGAYDGPGVFMKAAKDNADYPSTNEPEDSGIEVRYPASQARIALQLEEQTKIPVQWGSYTIEADGSMIVRERDLPAVKQALAEYRQTGDARALLDEDGKAIIDVYGTDAHFVEDNYDILPSNHRHYEHHVEQLLKEGLYLQNSNNAGETYIARQLQEGEALPVATARGDLQVAQPPDWIAVPYDKTQDVKHLLDNPDKNATQTMAKHIQLLDERTVARSYEQMPRAEMAHSMEQRKNTRWQNPGST